MFANCVCVCYAAGVYLCMFRSMYTSKRTSKLKNMQAILTCNIKAKEILFEVSYNKAGRDVKEI